MIVGVVSPQVTALQQPLLSDSSVRGNKRYLQPHQLWTVTQLHVFIFRNHSPPRGGNAQTQACKQSLILFVSERNRLKFRDLQENTAEIMKEKKERGGLWVITDLTSPCRHTRTQEVSREDHGKLSSSSSAISLANSRSCCSRSRRSWTHHTHKTNVKLRNCEMKNVSSQTHVLVSVWWTWK